jgi:hypothetical protein
MWHKIFGDGNYKSKLPSGRKEWLLMCVAIEFMVF